MSISSDRRRHSRARGAQGRVTGPWIASSVLLSALACATPRVTRPAPRGPASSSRELPLAPDDRADAALTAFVEHPEPLGTSTQSARGDPRAVVRTLGVTMRWDPGRESVELDPGNSPTWGGDPASDP